MRVEEGRAGAAGHRAGEGKFMLKRTRRQFSAWRLL